MSWKTFLVEIGTEELPPKDLRSLAEAFAEKVTFSLNKARLTYGTIEWFATPRRLAIKIENLATHQQNHEIKKRGPKISKAFDANGNPSEEAKNWARGCGIEVEQAGRLINDKGEWLLYYANINNGEKAEVLLPNIITTSLIKLPIPKLMRWGSSDIQFVRPVRTVTLLLDDIVIPTTIFGVKSDRVIRGHRFMGETEFTINHANQYPKILLEHGKVIASYEQRKAKIKSNIEEAAQNIGGNVDIKDNLLEEVTSIVEWPVVLTAKFEEKFLTIPIEVLVYTLKYDQKCFPIYTHDGKLLPNFIFVANIESKDPSQVISGNEKVVRSRLADAEFFFKNDRKKRLEDNLPLLRTVLFQKLGTLQDKTNRIVELSSWIAYKIGADINHAIRASLLSKCDLMTNMVFEFTDLQGIVGMHYARLDGEAEDVAVALNEQYRPRFSGDDLPSNQVSYAVAIADKIDTLTGIFGIGQYPKGNKDPFSLRRNALGVLRIIIEKNLHLDLQKLTEESVRLYDKKLTNINVVNDVINFMFCRLQAWYQDKGYSMNIIQAVMANRPTCPADFDARMKAISHFLSMKEATVLVSANKRVSNILAKTSEPINNAIYISLLKEEAEIKLATNLVSLHKKLQPYLFKWRYQEALLELATLGVLIDKFFENVKVNVDNKNIRINRLTLLFKLHELFLQIADISML